MLALALHALVITYLSYEVGRLQPTYRLRDNITTVDIELQRRLSGADIAKVPPSSRKLRRPNREVKGEHEPAPFVTPNAGPNSTNTPSSAVGGEAAEARPIPAMKGLKGCSRLGMTRQERLDCEERRWANAESQPKLDLDPKGRYAADGEPFLSKRPTKGCRGRATGDVGAFGDDSNVRAGITCVMPF